ncbi:hypothetical protein OC835_007831 [Tilletia horrida]|nr:hypothetical protein OC835_007831 [Tilletia horrida]
MARHTAPPSSSSSSSSSPLPPLTPSASPSPAATSSAPSGPSLPTSPLAYKSVGGGANSGGNGEGTDGGGSNDGGNGEGTDGGGSNDGGNGEGTDGGGSNDGGNGGDDDDRLAERLEAQAVLLRHSAGRIRGLSRQVAAQEAKRRRLVAGLEALLEEARAPTEKGKNKA